MSGIYALKPWFVGRLRLVEDVLVAHKVSPNTLTLAAVLVSVAGGTAIAGGAAFDQPLLWVAVMPLGIVRLAFNALDGSVARRLNRGSPRGVAFNELGDRACDLLMIAPLVAIAPVWLVLIAVSAMTLTSTAGVTAQAITGTRDTSGPMGKADRVLLVGLAATVAAMIGNHTPFVIALAVITAGCHVTSTARVSRLSKEPGDVR